MQILIFTKNPLVKDRKIMKYDHWDQERINFLINNYPDSTWTFLIENLGIQKSTILQKACELGIKRNYGYNEEDIIFIKNNYYKMPYKELGLILNKSEEAIASKISEMGLIKSEKWSEDDLNLLKEVYPHYTNKYLSEHYFPNRKNIDINNMAFKLGINKNAEKGYKWYNEEEMILQLKELGEKLGRTPKYDELVINGLPSQKTYERRFDGYRNACELAGLETNSNMFGRSLHCKSKNNDLCFSKAEQTITNFFIDNSINYKKDIRYSDFINDSRCGYKTIDWIVDDYLFIEYFGLPEKDYYYEKMEEKRSICRDCNIDFLELFRNDLNKLHIIFKDFIN
jgi:hypothetical protein